MSPATADKLRIEYFQDSLFLQTRALLKRAGQVKMTLISYLTITLHIAIMLENTMTS